jgi:hypothetical protein
VLPILDDYGAEVSWRPQGMTKAIPIRVPLKWAAISGSGPSRRERIFGGRLSLSGSNGHAPPKHADCFGAIDP